MFNLYSKLKEKLHLKSPILTEKADSTLFTLEMVNCRSNKGLLYQVPSGNNNNFKIVLA